MLRKFISVLMVGTIGISLFGFNAMANSTIVGHNKKIKVAPKAKVNTSSKATVKTNYKAITQNLDKYLTALEHNKNFHGSVLVAKDGKIILQKGYGMADVQNNIMINKDTRFAIGSITKQFTAMGIMQLYEKGKLSLNDKITKYLPEMKYCNDVTLHELLTHTSGVYNCTNLPELYLMNPKDISLMNVINLIKDKPLDFKPGEKYQYSNSGYLLLTYVLEKVSGMNYEDYLDKYIFKPLGMNDTGTSYKDGKYTFNTVGYNGYLDIKPAEDILLKAYYGAGSLCSTTGDLYKWDRALYTDKLLKKSTLKKMFTKYALLDTNYGYGYGFFITDLPYGNAIFHTGGTLVFTSELYRYIDNKATIIILTNNSNYAVQVLNDALASILFGDTLTAPKAPKVTQLDKSSYKNYTGVYNTGNSQPINIITSGEHLYFQFEGQPMYEILPESEKDFFSRQIDYTINFIFDSNNKVYALSVQQDGASLMATKQADTVVNSNATNIDESILNSYAGDYKFASGFQYSVVSENGHLYVTLFGNGLYEATAESENKFKIDYNNYEFQFNKDENGNIVSATIDLDGVKYVADKVK